MNPYYALAPPPNNASSGFSSDVAANNHLATLRTAVLQVPLVALKMSTVLAAVSDCHAKRVNKKMVPEKHIQTTDVFP